MQDTPIRISRTRKLPSPNKYAVALLQENLSFNYDEERVLDFKGKWRSEAFATTSEAPVDLEIGVGNGFHFAHYLETAPLDRHIIGLELKYKPLIQTARRALATGNPNFRVARYTAKYLGDLFVPGEIDNVYIHFPDPWAYKTKHTKNRLVVASFLDLLYDLQKQGSFVEFKTDHAQYFADVCEDLKSSKYVVTRWTDDLHNSEWAAENFQTHFEKLWTSKGLNSHMVRFEKI